MKRAIYAGSFDPLTNGHLWVIKEASGLFDEVLVTISHNPQKTSLFTLEEKKEILKECLKTFKNVKVEVLPHAFTALFAKEKEATYWVRGVRNDADLEYEKTISKVNAELNQDLKTVILIPPESLSHVSSSLVKSFVGFPTWQSLVGKYVPNLIVQKMNTKMLEKELLKEWVELTNDLSQKWFKKILTQLSEEQRYYHTATHVMDLLRKINLIETKEKEALKFAAWFHDLTYDPTKGDNEEKSAEQWTEFCKEFNINQKTQDSVRGIILATKNHTASYDETTSLFLDLDLSILAAPDADFKSYDENIRREFSFVPEDLYLAERKKIMTRFHEARPLFKTPWGQALEDKAKSNLKSII